MDENMDNLAMKEKGFNIIQFQFSNDFYDCIESMTRCLIPKTQGCVCQSVNTERSGSRHSDGVALKYVVQYWKYIEMCVSNWMVHSLWEIDAAAFQILSILASEFWGLNSSIRLGISKMVSDLDLCWSFVKFVNVEYFSKF